MIIEKYARFVAKYPFITFGIVLLVFVVAIIGSQMVKTSASDYQDVLPEEIDVMRATNYLIDTFGGTDQALFVIEIDPSSSDSNQPRDVQDPRIIKYTALLADLAKKADDVESATSAGTILRDQYGVVPQDREQIEQALEINPVMSSYLSEDRSMALVKISLEDNRDNYELLRQLEEIATTTPKPSGISIDIAGSAMEDPIIEESIGPDMSRTSNFSIIGIIVVLLILFRSFKFGLTPLSVIIIGTMWTMGYLGLTGAGISSMTSGAISMIMGIGIDFGIQTVMRYRQERKEQEPEAAMVTTLSQVIMPMATTTIAALVGFKAMSMGQLSFLAELGTIMSYGVFACFMAAITAVPSLLMIFEKIGGKA